jgi:exopolyphosphatase/guanosine-5'-triphosphate,3'-diphosphate pyrophosphatase
MGEPAGDDLPFAVVDIGSNSGRMIVFRLREGEHLDVLEDARSPLRLARALREGDELGAEAIGRAVEAFHDFKAVADGAGATRIIAVATSAVREARDGDALVSAARAMGIPLQVIDGELEARLGFQGAIHDLPVTSGFTIDIGGGSLEITRFDDREVRRSWSLPFGSLRASDRYFEHDPPTHKEMKALGSALAEALDGAGVTELRRHGSLVGIGGTVRNLAKVDLRRADTELPLLHGYGLRARRIGAMVEDLAERSMKRRATVPGLNPDRADTIVGGALVVLGVMEHVGARELVVSSRGLREGLALDSYGRDVPPASWVRGISVATLARRFNTWSAEAAEERSRIALGIIDVLDAGAPSSVREMLGHAATLVDVGRALDYYQRFEHAAMIVLTADLAGFSHADLGVLATILRDAGDEVSRGRLVDEQDRAVVERAAAALALAEDLYRRIPHDAEAEVRCTWTGDGFEVAAPVPAGWRPRGTAERFLEAVGRPLTVVPVDAA